MLLFTGACVCQVCHRWLITYQRSSENIVHIKEPLSDIQPLSASAGCQWPLQCCLSLPPSSILLSQSGLKLESINLILIKPCIMSSSPRVSLTALRSRSITAQDLCRQDLCEEACLSSNKTRQKWHFTPSGYGTIKIKQFFRFSDSLQREKRTKKQNKTTNIFSAVMCICEHYTELAPQFRLGAAVYRDTGLRNVSRTAWRSINLRIWI